MGHRTLSKIEQLIESQFLYLTTIGWKTTKQHRLEIWFVEYNKKYYIVSEARKRAHWVQNIIRNSRFKLTVDDETFEGSATIVDQVKEAKLANLVSKLMIEKYGWAEGLIA